MLVDLYGCDPMRLDDIDGVRDKVRRAAEIIGAVVVGETFHRFSPHGVSGVLTIAESHISLHTWPERGYVAIDVYTCGLLDPWPGVRHLCIALGASEYRTCEIVRGLPEELGRMPQGHTPDRWLITQIVPARSTRGEADGPDALRSRHGAKASDPDSVATQGVIDPQTRPLP